MSGGPYRVPGKVIPFPGTDTRKWRKEQVPLIWWADIPYCPICGEGGLGRFIRASTQIEGLERANLPDTTLYAECGPCRRIVLMTAKCSTPWWRRELQWHGRVRRWIGLEVPAEPPR